MADDDIIDEIITREGKKYTNDPADRGGPTKFGITLATLRDYHHDDAVTAEEVEDLTEDEAKRIYRALFVDRPKFALIANDNIRAFLVDWGVNSGPKRPIKALQGLVGVPADGILGTFTASKANSADQRWLYNALIQARMEFVDAIVAHDPTQERFIKGWHNRINSFKNVAWA